MWFREHVRFCRQPLHNGRHSTHSSSVRRTVAIRLISLGRNSRKKIAFPLNMVGRIYALVPGGSGMDVRADTRDGDSAFGKGRCRSIVKRTAFH